MGRWENFRQKLTVKSENSTWFVSPVWTERNYCVWSNFPAGQKFVHTVWTQSYKQNNNSKRFRKEAVLQVLKAACKFPRFTKTMKGVRKLQYSTHKPTHGEKRFRNAR